MTYHDKLLDVEEGQSIKVRVVDFENTSYPKEENPRDIEGEVKNINEDVSHSAGEIQRVITIGDVWDEGCKIDVGDTSKNQLTGRPRNSSKYTRAWRPRGGKDRVLLGEVESIQILCPMCFSNSTDECGQGKFCHNCGWKEWKHE